MRLAFATAAALAALTGTAAAMQAETIVRGETTEGASIKIVLGEFGNPTSFTVGRTKVDCREGGTLKTPKTTYTNFVTSDPGEFHLRVRDSDSHGRFDFKSVTKADGKWDSANTQNWSGILTEKTKVLRDGERVDICRLKTDWSGHS